MSLLMQHHILKDKVEEQDKRIAALEKAIEMMVSIKEPNDIGNRNDGASEEEVPHRESEWAKIFEPFFNKDS